MCYGKNVSLLPADAAVYKNDGGKAIDNRSAQVYNGVIDRNPSQMLRQGGILLQSFNSGCLTKPSGR